MKKNLLILAFTICGIANAQNTCTPIITNGLVAYYPFCGNANDVSSNLYNGTVNGPTLTTDRFGNLNSAYSFAAGTDNISLPVGMNIISSFGMTFSFWINTDWSNKSNMFLLDFEQAPGNRIAINFLNPTNGTEFGFNTNPATADTFPTNYSQYNNVWTFITGVIDITNMQARLYANGLLIGSKSLPPSITSINLTAGTFVIGNRNTFTNGAQKLMDDVSIYIRPLSPSEINVLYTGSFTGLQTSNNQTSLYTIFPNPASDKIFVSGLTAGSIILYNSIGSIVFESAVSNILDISFLTSGIYFVHMLDRNRTVVNKAKIIKE